MKQKSATFDENDHLIAGYSHLVMHDLRMEPGHPPLTKILAGMPLLFLNLKSPSEFKSWYLPEGARYGDAFKFGADFLYRSSQDADKILFFGRLPSVCIALLLGWFVFLWAKELYGTLPGYLALFLYVFSPNIIAHSQVVTPDIGLSCIMVITIYCFQRFFKTPGYHTFLVSAFCLGIAFLTKSSALVLLPIILIMLYFFLPTLTETLNRKNLFFLQPNQFRIRSWWLAFLFFLGMAGIAFVIVWIGYGFEYASLLPHKASHPTAVQLLSRYLPERFIPLFVNLAEKITIPFPSFFAGLAAIRLPLRDTFVMGMHSYGSPWFGYLVAFFIKTPIPSLIFLIVSLYYFFRGKTLCRKDEWFLLTPVIGFLLSSAIARFGLQLKYILPIYPFLFIFSSQIVNPQILRKAKYKAVVGVLCIWYFVGTVTIYPHYLAYFNELAGGPNNGYKYLVDSNLDWGQDLKLLKDYLDRNNIKEVKLVYFGTAEPSYYKINYQRLEPFKVSTGWIAISATHLQGVHTLKDAYSWLKDYEPVEKIGYSIFVYYIK